MLGLTNVNGVLPVMSLATMQENEKREAERTNASPVIQSLAAHVRECWSVARIAKQQTVEQRMLKSLRARRGEYDPEVLAEIRKGGGTEIYMMLTSNKCRGAASWLRDVLLGTGKEKPWTLDPTPLPELPPNIMQAIAAKAVQDAMQMEMATGVQVDAEKMKEIVGQIKDRVNAEAYTRAQQFTERMELKMEDQLVQGRYPEAMSEFIDDIVTFPSAIMKGPVIRRKPRMKWVPVQGGDFDLVVTEEIVEEWERVDPFMIYPAPNSADVDDGYLIERHKLSRTDLNELIGVEGYDDAAIRAVLDEYGRGGLTDWIYIDTAKAQAEGKSTLAVHSNPEHTIDALQFWGCVQGKLLREWGMTDEEVTDPLKDYYCEVWVIGGWVIKATLNYDPLGRKPYYKASYEEIPGSFWGNGVADLVRDCQSVCNAASRAMVNNMGIASGPQAVVNVDRLPSGEDVTQMYPWKIWQTTSDPYGSSAPPVTFFQPGSLSQELMLIYERFSTMADEYSGVPRYMTGDSSTGGAGRTASGMSMLMGNANKSIKQVVANIDVHVTEPLIERLYFYNMKYSDDKALKGDVNIVARGANMLIVKEQAQVRRNEFLNIVGTNPVYQGIVGNDGIANLLREAAKTLDMDTDKIVPPEYVLRAREAIAQREAFMQQQAMQMTAAQQQGMVMPDNGQQLQNGAPVTDNFTPQRMAR